MKKVQLSIIVSLECALTIRLAADKVNATFGEVVETCVHAVTRTARL